MAYSEELAGRIAEILETGHIAKQHSISAKRMFGGVCYLANGNMLVGVWRDALVARIGASAYDTALDEPHVREFNVTGRAMKGWVLVDPPGVEEDDQLARWLDRALAFVSTLPPQVKRSAEASKRKRAAQSARKAKRATSSCTLRSDPQRLAAANKAADAIRENFPPGIPQPALRALANTGLKKITDLTRVTEKQLAELHGMGPKAVVLLRTALEAMGRSFRRS